MAVISNLDENINRMQKRLDRLLSQCDRLASVKEKGQEILTGFNEVLGTLSRIVVPGKLLMPVSTVNEPLSDSGTSMEDTTLYDWIS